MAGKCELCDGRIVNGRCADCGMDYSRRKNRYHLNENCDEYDHNARILNDAFEDSLRGKGEASDKGKKEKIKLNSKASVKPNTQKKEDWSFEKILSDNVSSMQDMVKNRTKKQQTGKKSTSMLGRIIIVFTLISVAGSIFESISDAFDRTYTPEYEEVEITPEYEIELPSMPETGESIALELNTYGCYIAGVDIPVGIYSFSTRENDYGTNIHVQSLEYQLEDSYTLNAGDTLEDVRLYEGTRLCVDGNAVILCSSENAQSEDMLLWDGAGGGYNSIDAEEDEVEYWIGEDEISPGRYELRYVGEGTSVISVHVENSMGVEYITLANAAYNPAEARYIGLVLEEGDAVSVQRFGDDEAGVEFIPNESAAEGLSNMN